MLNYLKSGFLRVHLQLNLSWSNREDREITLADDSCSDLHNLDWGNHRTSEANPDQFLPFSTYIGYGFGEEKTLRCIWICQAPSFIKKVTKPVIKIWDSDKSDRVEVGFVQLKQFSFKL